MTLPLKLGSAIGLTVLAASIAAGGFVMGSVSSATLLVLAAIMAFAAAAIMVIVYWQVLKPLNALSKDFENKAKDGGAARTDLEVKGELGKLARLLDSIELKSVFIIDQLKEEKTRLEASISSLPLGFMLTDAEGKITVINPTMQKMVATKKTLELPADKGVGSLRQILDKCVESISSSENITYSFLTKDGHYLNVYISPITENSKVIGSVALVEDVTEAKVLERSKEEFFSIASHELRTPLTAIRGNATMLDQFYGEQLKAPEFDQMIKDIHTSSVRLIEIVNDFLDASKLEQGKMEYKTEPLDLGKVIDGVLEEMAALIKERGLYVKTDDKISSLPKVKADADRVKQIVYNLTGNALKFTENGGMTLKASVDSKFVKISIEDTGRGIPASKQALLFHKFQQAGNSLYTRDTTKGTGLGLYIAKLLTEQMGGKLTLDWSSEGMGSSFSFTLPLA